MTKRQKATCLSRRYRPAVLVMVLSCLFGSVAAQGFEKKFGGPKADFGQAILQTKDHGYIEVGSSEGELGDDNDFDIYVVRTDVDGTTVWTRRYDLGFVEQGFDVVQAYDGGFLIVGFSRPEPGAPERTLVLKVSRRGDLIFSKTYGSEGMNERGTQIIRLPGTGYLVTGYRQEAETSNNDVLATRIDEDGEVVWSSSFGGGRDDEGIGAVVTPDGGFIIGANVQGDIGADSDIGLFGVSPTGNLRWLKVYGTETENEQIEDIIPTSDGNLAFVGSTDAYNKALIAKADLNGDTLWYREIDASPFDDELRGVIEEDGGENLVAVGQTVPTGANLDVLMVKVRSSDGQPIWERRLGNEETTDIGEDLVPTLDGGYAIAAYTSKTVILDNNMSLFKTNNLGDLQTNYLLGKVYSPAANDCGPFTEGDLGLSGWLVRAEGETATFFGSTDSLGNYELRVDRGTYEVSLLRKNDRWNLCDPAPISLDLTQPYDTSFTDFALEPAIDCPLLEVTASATPAIRCGEQVITLSYSNQGAATATDASVSLTLGEELTFISSSKDAASIDGQTLIFEVGDLDPDASGSISVRAAIGCTDVVEGQAISSMVDISPVYNCSPVDPDWDGSKVVVTGRCDRDEGLSFKISNLGENPMVRPNEYVVVVDIVLRERGDFQLDAGEVLELELPFLDGDDDKSTVRLIAEQSAGHPGSLFPTAVVEGCNTEAANKTVGQVAQFPDNDGDLNLDILTQEVVELDNSANLQLTAYPRGYLDSIIIPKTDIEYTVFFALPANDSFERVVIRDTLPQQLDFNSLEMGSASHPYDFALYQGGILKITFDSIRIFSGGGTGEADAVSRQGYVSFRLSQKPNNLRGTVIRNRAAVYFDYDTPAISREVKHVVGCENIFSEDCLRTTSVTSPRFPGVTIHTNPNPVDRFTTVSVTGWKQTQQEFTFQLFDGTGRRVGLESFSGDQFRFERQKLAAGLYFYEVRTGGQMVGSGKLFLK